MSFSIDTIVRAWASTHDAPVEEAFGDFLVVGLSTGAASEFSARVPYVVQVDGTVAFGDAEPVTLEYVEMSDLTPSERVDLAVGEIGLGSTLVSLSIQSSVSSYIRRSKSGKAVRVKSYFRMIDAKDLKPGEVVLDRHNRRRVVDKVNGNVVSFKGGGTGTGQFSVATPNYVSGKRDKNTVVKDIKPEFNPQKQQPGKIAKALKAVKRELTEGDGGTLGKDYAFTDPITGRRWDAEGYPKGTRARHTPQGVEVESDVSSLPPNGDFSKWSDEDLAKELDERERDIGLYPGAEAPRDEVRAEVVARDALKNAPVSAAPYPSKAVPASDIKANDLIDLDGNVRVVTSATPVGDSVLLSTTTPRGGDVQNSVVKKTSMVKKLVVALAAVLLAIGAGNAGEHFETDYHPHEESISQMVEGRGIVGINAPGNVSNPGFRITAPRKKFKKVPSNLPNLSDGELDALRADIQMRGQGAKGEYQPGSLREVMREMNDRHPERIRPSHAPFKKVPSLTDMPDAELDALEADIRKRGQGAKGEYQPGSLREVYYERNKRGQATPDRDLSMLTDAELDALEADIRKRGQGGANTYAGGSLRNVYYERNARAEIAKSSTEFIDSGDGEFIAEDDPTAIEARKLVGKVTTDGGFTYNPRTSTYVEHGFAVAMPGNSVIIKDADFTGEAAVDAVIKYLDEHEDKVFSNGRIQIGGWHDTEHGEVVLDLSEIFEDMIEAMRAGAERDEQAIFDLDTFTEIPTGGTGGRVELSMLVDEYLALANGSIPLSTSNYAWEEGA